ncbi:MAG: DUF3108 domain-containing protein [Pseudolabrys sp.]
MPLTAASLALAVTVLAAPARAQGKLEARYTASIAGIPIGKGNWVIDIGDTHYSAAASGRTLGLLRLFIGGEGTSAAHGTFGRKDKFASSIYAATISTRDRTTEARVAITDGDLATVKLDPPREKNPKRVPITKAHEHGIFDPMTGSLLRVPGKGRLLTPAACDHTVAVFDGRLRYDLKLTYKRMEKVHADKGYAGPVVVCTVQFLPVAGFDPTRTAIRYIKNQRDMEVWLAPIAGTRVLVPFRAQTPTPIGEAILEADQFVSTPGPSRASLERGRN